MIRRCSLDGLRGTRRWLLLLLFVREVMAWMSPNRVPVRPQGLDFKEALIVGTGRQTCRQRNQGLRTRAVGAPCANDGEIGSKAKPFRPVD